MDLLLVDHGLNLAATLVQSLKRRIQVCFIRLNFDVKKFKLKSSKWCNLINSNHLASNEFNRNVELKI